MSSTTSMEASREVLNPLATTDYTEKICRAFCDVAENSPETLREIMDGMLHDAEAVSFLIRLRSFLHQVQVEQQIKSIGGEDVPPRTPKK